MAEDRYEPGLETDPPFETPSRLGVARDVAVSADFARTLGKTQSPTLKDAVPVRTAARGAPISNTATKQLDRPLNPPKSGGESGQADLRETLARDAPPWLVSAIVHMIVLIAFGILVLSEPLGREIEPVVDYAEDIGDQLDDDLLAMNDIDLHVEEPVFSPSDLAPVDDPLAAPAPIDPSALALNLTSDQPQEIVGVALSGREKGAKEALLAAYGGTATTEAAVMRGLEWLARNQTRRGAWKLSGPYSDGVRGIDNEEAATAMALLAFQGAGFTPKGDPEHRFTKVVEKGWNALLKKQQDDGCFVKNASYNHFLYSHAQCTIAVCELYAMTEDSRYKEPAQRAVDFCVAAQSPEGGWRYYPGRDSDTSVTGWFVMALKSAEMAGLHVPSETWMRVGEFLDTVSHEDGSEFSYIPSQDPKLSMTAEGLLCRQYMGWKRDDARLIRGVDLISKNLIDPERQDVYYWYYATQVCHHMEKEAWRTWNEVMRKALPASQVREGPERGSWDRGGDRWGHQGGRLYTTCLSIYMLEVYYRHLPLYRREMVSGQ